MDRWKMKELK